MTTKPLKYTARSGVISFFYIKLQLHLIIKALSIAFCRTIVEHLRANIAKFCVR